MLPMNETTKKRSGRPAVRGAIGCLAFACALAAPGPRALGVDITMDVTQTSAGAAKLCVGVGSGGQQVVGTQNDIVWDPACAALKVDTCAAVPESKKPLHGSVPVNLTSTYRAFVFATDNVDPMRDGRLYCCDVDVRSTGDGCCAVRLDRVGASDASGGVLASEAKPPQLCLASASAVPPAAAPPAAAASPAGELNRLWLLLPVGVAVLVAAVLMLRRKK